MRVVAVLLLSSWCAVGCWSRPRYELEYEQPVTNVWVDGQPAGAADGRQPSSAPAVTRTPAPAVVTSTTRPSAWVRPDPTRPR